MLTNLREIEVQRRHIMAKTSNLMISKHTFWKLGQIGELDCRAHLPQSYQKRLELPGFRKGKVPLNVVNRRFGDAIRGNVINDILPTLLEEATREAGLVPAAPPRIEKLDYEPGESLTRDQALSGAPRHDDRFFLVPPVLDTSAE